MNHFLNKETIDSLSEFEARVKQLKADKDYTLHVEHVYPNGYKMALFKNNTNKSYTVVQLFKDNIVK